MKKLNCLAWLFVAAISTGCAFNPQQAVLKPNVDLAQSSIGAGKTLYLNIIDERESKALGRRGTATFSAAEITSNEDLAVVVKRELSKGFQQKGFKVTEAQTDADNKLTVEIRALSYATSTGFWTGGVHIKGAFKGKATSGDNNFEKMYRYEKEERVIIVPTAETNEQWINEALSETLKKVLEDDEMLRFLAS